jgi:hypothetical protein
MVLAGLLAGLGGCLAPGAGQSPPGLPSRSAWGKAKGMPWTILCLEVHRESAAPVVEQIAETLKQTPGIRASEVFIRHDPDGFTRLYYGRYYRKLDSKTGRRPIPEQLRRDLEFVAQLGDEAGRRYFARARTIPEPQPDVGNPEWALTRASGVYSLQVAAFEPTDDFWEFKKAAADYCEWLRKKGYEAYYHHGESCSIVTVGSFGAEAVRPLRRRVGTNAGGSAPAKSTPGPAPAPAAAAEAGPIPEGVWVSEYSPEVAALQQDELLKYNLLNGAIVRARMIPNEDMPGGPVKPEKKKAGKFDGVPVPSLLVPIPKQAKDLVP